MSRTCKLSLTLILQVPDPDATPFHLRYRFAEIYYRRGESTHKGRSTPARVETTVLFLPDVWNVCPTKLEWDGLHLNYKRQLDKKLSSSAGCQQQPEDQEEEEEDKALIRPFSSLRFTLFLQTISSCLIQATCAAASSFIRILNNNDNNDEFDDQNSNKSCD